MSTATLSAADYHRDLDGPTLSSSIARTLHFKTPAHAKAEHPRLTDQPATHDTPATDLGTAVHQLLLRDDRVDVLEWDSYRTKAAQEARDECRANGRVPLLAKEWERANLIAARVREQVAEFDVTPKPFTHGTPETVLRWNDNGAECRAMLDWLFHTHEGIDDLKTTGLTAEPHEWARKLFNAGYDIQAAFYTRAVEAVHGVTPRFRWLVVETKPPYPVSMLTLSDAAMFAARVKVDRAIEVWNACLASGVWPAYSREVFEADLPGWMKDRADGWADIDMEGVPF